MTFDIVSDGMDLITALWPEIEEKMKDALQHRVNNFGKSLFCYGPTSYSYRIPAHSQTNPSNFISISVTGHACSLDCEHCKGRLLYGMEPAKSPEHLLNRLKQIKEMGGTGVLISGGSDSRGHVPLLRFGSAIFKARKDFGLEVVVHTGLINRETAEMLAKAEITAAMLDIIGDDDTAREIYHLEHGTEQIRKSLSLLSDVGIPIVPHIMVGLYYGQLKGELNALELISAFSPAAVVVIALNPLRKTPFATISPPSPETIGRILTIARLGMKNVPLLLGCARPLGEHKRQTDRLAVRSGVNGIAYISQAGVDEAIRLGLSPIFKDVCCSLAYKHFKKYDLQ